MLIGLSNRVIQFIRPRKAATVARAFEAPGGAVPPLSATQLAGAAQAPPSHVRQLRIKSASYRATSHTSPWFGEGEKTPD